MKWKSKKVLSVLLSIALLLTMVPVYTAHAEASISDVTIKIDTSTVGQNLATTAKSDTEGVGVGQVSWSPDAAPASADAINVTGITFDKGKVNFTKVGETAQLTAAIAPENADNQKVTWTSSNPKVATVDENGKVTAVGNGTCTITVTTEDGNMTATCEVTVTDNSSGNTVANITIPTAPTIVSIKGGNKRVRLYWDRLSEATGYKIYYSTTKTGTYKLLQTITRNATTSYLKTGLKQNKKYYFKMTSYITSNGRTLTSPYSAVVSVKTCTVPNTSRSALKYNTKKQFKASPAYKKYEVLRKAQYSKSFAIPGLKNTNVGGFASKTMVPQAMCQAGGYILISAYDSAKKNESVIYVLSRTSHTCFTTLVLPNKTKATGMAYDGKNIWISNGNKKAAYFPYSVITAATEKGDDSYYLDSYTGSVTAKTQVGVMAYYNNTLWIGKSNSSLISTMYGYSITTSKKTGKCSLTKKHSMRLPSRVHGITFDSKGYLYITRSNKTNPKNSKYISCVQTFKPSLKSSKSAIAKGKMMNKQKLPPKVEGVVTYGKYLYTLYSSCADSKSKYPVDRVIATKLSAVRR